MEKIFLEVSWTSLWKILFFVVAVILVFTVKDIFFGLFLAMVISSGLEGPIDKMEKRGIPRSISAIIIFLFIVALITVFLYAVVPIVIVNINTAVYNIQKAAHGAWWQPLFNIKTSRSINDFMTKVVDNFISNGSSPFDAASQVLGGVSLTISVIILSFYLSVRKNGVEKFIKLIAPLDYEEMAIRIVEHSRRRIGMWFRAQFVLSLIMGVMVWTALGILGVQYAPILGATAGVLELVPFIGPIIAGAISVLVAVSASNNLAIYTLITFLILQQFESNILVPLLMNRATGLNPILVIISLLIGIELGGFIGALIAVPAAAVFQEIVEDWNRDKSVMETA